jgi:hypothetical protein
MTVNGTIEGISTDTKNGARIRVKPVSVAVITETGLRWPVEQSAYVEDDAFSIELKEGVYDLYLGDVVVRIDVPAGDGEVNVEDIATDVTSDTTFDPEGALTSAARTTTMSVTNGTALRLLTNRGAAKVICYLTNPAAREPKVVIWSSTSTATDDGSTVFKPADTDADEAGRWLEW